MSMATDNLDDATVSRVTRNLELVRRFAAEIAANPRVMEEIPSGEVVLIPDDDPELAASNIDGGVRRVREGHNLTFYHVRATAATALPPDLGAVFTPLSNEQSRS